MAKHWYPVFSSEKCLHCNACLLSCPINNLEPDSNAVPVLIQQDSCPPNCFECAKSCKNGAIGVIRPAKPCDCCSF